jgi:hypothetical protein
MPVRICRDSVWNSAGIWQPAGDSVRDFVLIAIERRRRDLRAVRFGLWFAAVETILLVAWLLLLDVSRRFRLYFLMLAPVSCATAASVVWAAFKPRRKSLSENVA